MASLQSLYVSQKDYEEFLTVEDYSHCHYWDNKRECIGFDCDICEYKQEYEDIIESGKLDEDLFEI